MCRLSSCKIPSSKTSSRRSTAISISRRRESVGGSSASNACSVRIFPSTRSPRAVGGLGVTVDVHGRADAYSPVDVHGRAAGRRRTSDRSSSSDGASRTLSDPWYGQGEELRDMFQLFSNWHAGTIPGCTYFGRIKAGCVWWTNAEVRTPFHPNDSGSCTQRPGIPDIRVTVDTHPRPDGRDTVMTIRLGNAATPPGAHRRLHLVALIRRDHPPGTEVAREHKWPTRTTKRSVRKKWW